MRDWIGKAAARLGGSRSDSELLDFLEVNKQGFPVRLEISKMGRGFGLRSGHKGKTYPTVREAIRAVMQGSESEVL